MNISNCIKHLFPNSTFGIDYVVQDDSDENGPYIAAWNLTDSQPTESDLVAAWEIIKDRPLAKTQQEKEIDELKAAKEQANLSIIELWENIIPLLP